MDQPEARPEARENCFMLLADEPNNVRCRIVLARLFYLDSLTEFAIREIVEACRRQPAPSLYRLIEGFGQSAARYTAALAGAIGVSPNGRTAAAESKAAAAVEEVDTEVAEIEIDGELMDILDELDDGDIVEIESED